MKYKFELPWILNCPLRSSVASRQFFVRKINQSYYPNQNDIVSMETKRQDEQQHENQNWSEAVEDLVAGGDTEGAIRLLETLISKLQNLELASALTQLANLYSSKGFSLKSDELLSRAQLIGIQALRSSRDTDKLLKQVVDDSNARHGDNLDVTCDAPCNVESDDDWEAVADRAPDELLASQCLPSVSKISLDDTKGETTKRRGRGTFSYRKNELYSDRLSEPSFYDDEDDQDSSESKQNAQSTSAKYGTRHVLVLADFPPATRTIELEKLFADFGDTVSIRWVNDTTALAVFRDPSIALNARNSVQCPFTVRILCEDDVLLSSVKPRDLEPPRRRPQTSARTAQRLIAQGMGLKLPSTFGSRELKAQEEARKNRIVTRQKQKQDAWGDDDN